VLDLHFTAVTEAHQLFDEFDGIGNIADTNPEWFDFADMWTKPLNECANRRDDHRGRSFGFVKAPQDARSSTHRVDGGTHTFEWEGLPCRKEFDLVGSEERRQVMHETLSFRGRGNSHNNGPALSPID
jgi:hypothetical protein